VSRFGGWNRVDRQRLRRALLDADLAPVIRADPPAAAELVRRTVIDHETRPRRLGLEEGGLGITEAPRWRAAVPERGPFLALLIIDSETGIECIVDLAEYATEQWAENARQDEIVDPNPFAPDRDPDIFEALMNGEAIELIGDASVLHWHRNDGHAPTVLACALMALESFLYRRIDAAEDIDGMLERLLRSRSLAIWGLLADVARYQPALLRDRLAPLISSAALLVDDKGYALRGHTHLGLIGLSDRAYRDRLNKWNAMPHRKLPLSLLLMRDVLGEKNLVGELTAARELWRTRDGERWKHLLAQTDPANHVASEREDGAIVFDYVAPAYLQAEVAETDQELFDSGFWLTLPYRLREWIDRRSQPSNQEVELFWKEAQTRLAEQPADDEILSSGVRNRADVECGLAALFVLCAQNWLRVNPDAEQWCRRVLLAPFENPPPAFAFDHPTESSTERWDSFCADAVPALWAEQTDDPELRSAITRLANHPRYLTVRQTMRAVATYPSLAEGMEQLEHLTLHFARYRAWRQERSHRERSAELDFGPAPTVTDMPDVESPTRQALAQFVAGSLSPPPSLSAWIDDTPVGMVGPAMGPRARAFSKIDPGYLIAARTYLPETLAGDKETAAHIRGVEFAADLAQLLVTGLAEDPDPDGPWQEEEDAYELLSEVILALSAADARRVWRPILELGNDAERWVERFLSALWLQALSREAMPSTFPIVVKEMILFAGEAGSWKKPHPDIAATLVDLNSYGFDLIHDRHPTLVAELLPEWADWVRPLLGSSRYARAFARFLRGVGADPVRADGLTWLAEREREGRDPDADLDNVIAELLVTISIREPALLRSAEPVGENSRYLLSRLAGRGQRLALELSRKLG
jgi:hypothetical protein